MKDTLREFKKSGDIKLLTERQVRVLAQAKFAKDPKYREYVKTHQERCSQLNNRALRAIGNPRKY
jgi:hypothetical protein